MPHRNGRPVPGRIVVRRPASGVDGSFAFEVDTQRLPQAILTAAQAGETWTFQAWFRDSAPVPTAHFSDSVSVTFR